MDTPKKPEKPDWVEGPLHEEWDLGKYIVDRSRVWGGFPPSPEGLSRAKARAIVAWTKYYEEVDRVQDQEG